MRSINARDLLAAWELGLAQNGARRLVMVLAAVYPEYSAEQLLALPLGRRDSLALELRELLFGSQLISLACCPSCGEQLELNLNVADIQTTPPHNNASFHLKADGYQVEFRLPDSVDLLALETADSVENARHILLKRCVLAVSRDNQFCAIEQLPAALVEKMEQTMEDADPQANIQLDLACPACQHTWLARFDIASFLWKELHTWAQRLLGEVHILARAYAWSESDILALTPVRRHFYLEQLGREARR